MRISFSTSRKQTGVYVRQAGYCVLAVPSSVVWHKVSVTLGTTSPMIDYYMLRNHLRLIGRHWSGARRNYLWSRVILRNLMTIAAFTVKPHGGRRIPNRNAATARSARCHARPLGQDGVGCCSGVLPKTIMRVLCLSTWFPYPPDNGSKIRAHYLLRALAETHEVTVVAFRPGDAQSTSYPEMPHGERLEVHPVQMDPYRHVAASALVRYASPLPLAFWPSGLMRQTVARLSKAQPWDAVVAIQSPVAQYALQVHDTPLVIDVDTALSYQMRERFMKQSTSTPERIRNWVSWQKAHRYEAHMFCKFRSCTVAASHELSYVSAMVRPTQTVVRVVPNGVDCKHNQLGIAQPDPTALVFNGAMTYSANFNAMQFFLTDIYPYIQQQVGDASLTITGKTSGVQLSALRLDDTVHLSGYVDDIRPVIAGAAVCVVPLRLGGGTRLKILEAMALGTPVVSTTKGAEGLEVTPISDILIADEPARVRSSGHAIASRCCAAPTSRKERSAPCRAALRLAADRAQFRQPGRGGGRRAERQSSMMIDSPRLRNAFADRQVRTLLVAAMVLLAAVVLGSHASMRWLVLPCAGLAIVAMARHPILGARCRDRHSHADPIRVGHGPGSQPESYSFADTSHICAMVPDHGATP